VVFSDRDLTSDPAAVEAAPCKMPAFFAVCCLTNTVIWLRDRIAKYSDSAFIRASGINQFDSNRHFHGDKPKGMPKPLNSSSTNSARDEKKTDLLDIRAFLKLDQTAEMVTGQRSKIYAIG